MDKKKFILGAALMVGLDKKKFMKHCGIPPATFDRRMKRPDTITLGELRVMANVADMTDDQIIQLVRAK